MPSTVGREIFDLYEVMDRIKVISESEENFYSDIPRWEGRVATYTPAAVCLAMPNHIEIWMPISMLRKAEDGQSIYAHVRILDQKGLT